MITEKKRYFCYNNVHHVQEQRDARRRMLQTLFMGIFENDNGKTLILTSKDFSERGSIILGVGYTMLWFVEKSCTSETYISLMICEGNYSCSLQCAGYVVPYP